MRPFSRNTRTFNVSNDMIHPKNYLLPFQIAWVKDRAPLKLMQKSRQVGASFVDALDSVIKAARKGATLDVWVSSRDEKQARLYLRDCLNWAKLLQAHPHCRK